MEPKPKVVVTWPISDKALALLREKYEVAVNEKEEALSPEELLGFVKGAHAILCLLTNKITGEVCDAAGSQLKIVATMSVGFDHIDLAATAQRGIVVTNTPGTSDNAVAEHTITLMLSLAKHIPLADKFVRQGKYSGWDPKIFNGPELSGKVLSIVGLGHIGSRVAHIAGFGLGMAIAYTDIRPNPDFESKFNAKYFSVDEVFSVGDVVTVHVPLLPATKHLVNAARLSTMKPTAYLVNTSRGPVVDEAALTDALKRKLIAGAAIDVYENEPNITPDLLSLENVIMTPHTASATFEAREAMAQKAVANILAVLSGQPALDLVQAK
ncbi:MAG TPA: D-glycerate dehydrogenase [Patescibacteria group bacterium]